jgi:hypothetical protein
MYHTKGESLVTSIDNEQTMIDNLINEEHGRKKENFRRIEGDIFEIPHNLTVYYTTLDDE